MRKGWRHWLVWAAVGLAACSIVSVALPESVETGGTFTAVVSLTGDPGDSNLPEDHVLCVGTGEAGWSVRGVSYEVTEGSGSPHEGVGAGDPVRSDELDSTYPDSAPFFCFRDSLTAGETTRGTATMELTLPDDAAPGTRPLRFVYIVSGDEDVFDTSIEVLADDPDSDSDSDSDTDSDTDTDTDSLVIDDECGCATPGRPGAVWVLALSLLVARRRTAYPSSTRATASA